MESGGPELRRAGCHLGRWSYLPNKYRGAGGRDRTSGLPVTKGLLQPGQPLLGILILGNARVGALGPFLYSLFLNLSSKSMRLSFIRA